MKTGLFLCVLGMAVAYAQDKDKLGGFTKSPTEHIINKLEEPFEVRSVSGVVMRQGGEQEPLRDVLVEIKGPGDHDRIRRTKTDDHGQFKISHVPAGTYSFKVTLDGYQSVMGRIVVSKNAAKNNSIKIAML